MIVRNGKQKKKNYDEDVISDYNIGFSLLNLYKVKISIMPEDDIVKTKDILQKNNNC